jgi:hypothetical protein
MTKPNWLLYVGIGIAAYIFAGTMMSSNIVGKTLIVNGDTYLQPFPTNDARATAERLNKGTRVTVIDGGSRPGHLANWIQVRDEVGRIGWTQEGMVSDVGAVA